MFAFIKIERTEVWGEYYHVIVGSINEYFGNNYKILQISLNFLFNVVIIRYLVLTLIVCIDKDWTDGSLGSIFLLDYAVALVLYFSFNFACGILQNYVEICVTFFLFPSVLCFAICVACHARTVDDCLVCQTFLVMFLYVYYFVHH